MQSERYQGRFRGYTGRKLWEVEHPAFGRCVVAAPDENAALMAAAGVWHTSWGEVAFYSNAKVASAGTMERGSDG